MTGSEAVRNYPPRTDVIDAVHVEAGAGGVVWQITLSDDATIVEAALLMSGLRAEGMEAVADYDAAGNFVLRPRFAGFRAPGAQMMATILSRGFSGRLPSMLLKQAE